MPGIVSIGNRLSSLTIAHYDDSWRDEHCLPSSSRFDPRRNNEPAHRCSMDRDTLAKYSRQPMARRGPSIFEKQWLVPTPSARLREVS